MRNRQTPEEYRRKWGIPDWHNSKGYPNKLSDDEWRWEFLRRRDDYRKDWQKWALKIENYNQLIWNCGSTNGLQKELLSEIIKLGRGINAVFGQYGFPQSMPIDPATAEPEMLMLESPYGPDIRDLARVEPMAQVGSLYRLSESHCAFFFELGKAINPQIKKAQQMLLRAQRERSREIADIRLHRDKFSLYLRALDAEAESTTYECICEALEPRNKRPRARGEEILRAAHQVQDFLTQ